MCTYPAFNPQRLPAPAALAALTPALHTFGWGSKPEIYGAMSLLTAHPSSFGARYAKWLAPRIGDLLRAEHAGRGVGHRGGGGEADGMLNQMTLVLPELLMAGHAIYSARIKEASGSSSSAGAAGRRGSSRNTRQRGQQQRQQPLADPRQQCLQLVSELLESGGLYVFLETKAKQHRAYRDGDFNPEAFRALNTLGVAARTHTFAAAAAAQLKAKTGRDVDAEVASVTADIDSSLGEAQLSRQRLRQQKTVLGWFLEACDCAPLLPAAYSIAQVMQALAFCSWLQSCSACMHAPFAHDGKMVQKLNTANL